MLEKVKLELEELRRQREEGPSPDMSTQLQEAFSKDLQSWKEESHAAVQALEERT